MFNSIATTIIKRQLPPAKIAMIKGTSNYENLTILLTSRVSALTVGAVELLLRKTAFNLC